MKYEQSKKTVQDIQDTSEQLKDAAKAFVNLVEEVQSVSIAVVMCLDFVFEAHEKSLIRARQREVLLMKMWTLWLTYSENKRFKELYHGR